MAYVDQNGNRNNSLVRLKFLNVPAEYISQQYDIQIRKWTASPSGVVKPSNTETPYYANVRVDRLVNGVYSAASTWNYNKECSTCPTLEWYNMNLIAKKQSQTFTDANAFFAEYHLLIDLEDPNGDWKALQVNFVTPQGVTVKTTNILIPAFDANPADYQVDHPPVLSNLHPFKNMLGQGWSASQFETESKAFCF
jgi:hypothetical protein